MTSGSSSARTGSSTRRARCRSRPSASIRPGPVRPYEFEVAVERLCLDSTSLRNIRERADGDPARMAGRIAEIVAVARQDAQPRRPTRAGCCSAPSTAVGRALRVPPAIGERIVTLGSLTLTPLRLDAVNELDPGSTQVEVAGNRLRLRAGRLGSRCPTICR